MKFGLLNLMLFVLISAAVVGLVSRYLLFDVDGPPPKSVLKNLDQNFGKLKKEMDEEEVFKTLGLNRYHKFLRKNSEIQMDGAGGNWRHFLKDHDGYSLAFRDFFGNVCCWIKTPEHPEWRKVEISADPIRLDELHGNQ